MADLNDPRRPEPAKPVAGDSEPLDDVLKGLEDLPHAEPANPNREFSEPLVTLSGVLRDDERRLQKRRTELQQSRFAALLARDYERAFFDGDRVEAFALSERLAELERAGTGRGLPPCFRIDSDSFMPSKLSQEQKFDLFVHDLQWLAAKYPEHKAKGRYAELLDVVPDDSRWLRQAEFFWSVRGVDVGIWMVIRQLGLNVAQQWECMALRTRPIKDKARGIRMRRAKVRKALEAKLAETEKTGRGPYRQSYSAYGRRFKVWVCAEMAGRKPQATADLYRLWTGDEISRMTAYDDIGWLHREIPESRPARKRPSKE